MSEQFSEWCGGFLLIASSLAGRASPQPKTGSWSGVLVNAVCTADEAFAERRNAMPPRPANPSSCTTTRSAKSTPSTRKNWPRAAWAKALPSAARSKTTPFTSHRSSPSGSRSGCRPKSPGIFGSRSIRQRADARFPERAKGTVLLFYRSADWCPYCKGQLIQLQAAKARFEKQGIKLAGISYDSVDILKFFADRRKIEFPLLSDPDSKIIRMYQVLNSEAMGPNQGMARPGYFFIDTAGRDPRKIL